jgi:threonine/homoserine/homoserine lactone efflux protein
VEARLLAFLGIAVVLTVTPGPDFALVTRVGLGRGRTAAWYSTLGVVSGHVTWGLAAGVGLATILHASSGLYTTLRLAGAAYLIWLGLHALLSRGQDQETVDEATPHALPMRRGSAYRQGLVNDLLNPKIGVFYSTLLPQFIVPGQSVFLSSVLLASLFALIVVLWLGAYVMFLDRADAFFRRAAVKRTLERITGVVLVGLGVRVALERS